MAHSRKELNFVFATSQSSFYQVIGSIYFIVVIFIVNVWGIYACIKAYSHVYELNMEVCAHAHGIVACDGMKLVSNIFHDHSQVYLLSIIFQRTGDHRFT